MKVFANTDVGLVRQLNEDDYCIAHNANDEWMAIVCDGIGGAKAGEVASHTAVMTMYEAFMKSPVFEKDRQVDNWIRENLNQANDFIYSKSSQKFFLVLSIAYKFCFEQEKRKIFILPFHPAVHFICLFCILHLEPFRSDPPHSQVSAVRFGYVHPQSCFHHQTHIPRSDSEAVSWKVPFHCFSITDTASRTPSKSD